MQEFIMVIKTFVITCLLLLLLQYKIGEQSLEEKSLALIRHSSVSHFLEQSAQGAIKIFYNTKNYILNFAKDKNWISKESDTTKSGFAKYEGKYDAKYNDESTNRDSTQVVRKKLPVKTNAVLTVDDEDVTSQSLEESVE